VSPDDPRHGTNAGYSAGCRDDCCKRGHMVEMKRYRMSGRGLISCIGTRRRVEALEAIGWTRANISRELGYTREYVGKTLRNDLIRQDTADAIAAVYDRLSMVVPVDPPNLRKGQTRAHETARRRAARLGFAPPLAWDDIDDPDERPSLGGRLRDQEVDDVVVERLLAGERIKSNAAEKYEAMRRWLAMGRSARSICKTHGWQDGRYVERQDGAA
jgi:hypothetical protein